MSITEKDVKMVQSSVMLDVPEGGGAASAIPILDGSSNSIFDDVSELDRAGGRVSLRKTHMVVETHDTDGFFGSNVIISEPPKDPLVSVTLFTTKDYFDRRDEAANRVEAYLFASSEWNGYLFENHIKGQRTIQLFQRVGTTLPPVGRTLVLIHDEGKPSETRQYVRVINVEAEERTFTFEQGGQPVDYQAWVVACELSDALRYDFVGSPASRFFTREKLSTITRDTRVTDAAQYYGVSPLKAPVALGSLKAQAKSIFTALVPSAQTEIPLPNQVINPEVAPMTTTSKNTYSFTHSVRGVTKVVAPTGITPNTLRTSHGGVQDNGLGALVRSGQDVGTIDYATGEMTGDWNTSEVITFTYLPATLTTQQTFTLFRDVTAESRRFNWIETLLPTPAPGTLTFSYMAQGNWYSLTDNGAGEMVGSDPAYGAGTINYVTGNMSVTTGVLPDADTAIMLVWATPAHYAIRDASDVQAPSWTYSLENVDDHAVVPETVSIKWEVDGTLKELTDDGEGFLEGDGWGALQYANGNMYFVMDVLPDPQTTPQVTYDKSLIHEEEFYPSKDGNGFVDFTLSHYPIVKGSLVIGWETIRSKTVTEKTTDSLGGAVYYSSSEAYSSTDANNKKDVWKQPNNFTQKMGWVSGHPNSVTLASQTVRDKSTSSSLSVSDKQSIKESNSFRSYSERQSSDSESNVVVNKIATDNGDGLIYGPQAGIVDYDEGYVRFIPTDIARTSSWGLADSGSFKTDSSSSSSSSRDETWAGSNYNMLTYRSGGQSGTDTSAGYTTKKGESISASGGESSEFSEGEWGSESFSDTWGNGSMIQVAYVEAGLVPTNETETLPSQNVRFNLSPYTAQTIVQGSVMVRFGGALYVDRSGKMIMDPDPATGSGLEAGTINYATGDVELSFWNAGALPNLEVLSCLTIYGTFVITSTAFRTAAAPLKSEALQVIATSVNGEQIIGTSDSGGWIQAPNMIAKVNYTTGIVQVAFGNYGPIPNWQGEDPSPTVWRALPIDASTVRYNAVAYSYLPLDAEILGLDPVRLPQDGKVPIFRKGEFAVIGHTDTYGPVTVANSMEIDLGRNRLSRLRVLGADGMPIQYGYTRDLEAGTVTFEDVAGYDQPITIEHRIEDMAQISDVQINGELSFTRPISHDYPAETSYVASALIAGDLRARVSHFWDQQTWDNTWTDSIQGNAAVASYNDTVYPIVVTNAGAITERWALRFTSSSSFDVIGENVGLVYQGSINAECAPMNPVTNVPYFTIASAGWGSGWSAGNVVRMNTVGAQFPVWVVRTVQQGPETVPNDCFTLLVRGDVDTQ